MTKTTYGLIGTGIVGERIIQQILAHPTSEIIAVFDENKERLATIANKYDLAVVEDLQQLYDLRPDWVYIGTPPASHAPLAQQIAAQGLHILAEKPLAHDVAAGELMVEAIQSSGSQSAMHFPMMYSPAVHTLKKAVATGELGEIVRIELHTHFATWPRPWQQTRWIASREQGGFIREVFPHYLQLTHHIFGDMTIEAHQTIYPADPTLCETGVTALAKTAAGIPVLLNGLAGIGQQEHLEYRVYGTEKVMIIRNWSELWVSEPQQPAVQLKPIEEPQTLFDACHAKTNGQQSMLVSFEEGLRVQGWIDELLK